jgi:hypothetical protein
LKNAPEILPGWPAEGTPHAQTWRKIWEATAAGGVTVTGSARALGLSAGETGAIIRKAASVGLLTRRSEDRNNRTMSVYYRRQHMSGGARVPSP